MGCVPPHSGLLKCSCWGFSFHTTSTSLCVKKLLPPTHTPVIQADDKGPGTCMVLKGLKHHLLTHPWARWGAAAVERTLTSHSSKTNSKCACTIRTLWIFLHIATWNWLSYLSSSLPPPSEDVPGPNQQKQSSAQLKPIDFDFKIIILNIHELTVNEHSLFVRYCVNALYMFSKFILTITPLGSCYCWGSERATPRHPSAVFGLFWANSN